MKRLVFLSGTRADFGKLKSLIEITNNQEKYETHIFATGMHLNTNYGYTIREIYKSGFKNVFPFINHNNYDSMDLTTAKTIEGFSRYVSEYKPDLIIIHGDRSEALAGAIVGSMNNILVAHIEGGEVSGTIDELIRHAVSKLAHFHFVANDIAYQRLIQLGELPESIRIIGSPDLDIMERDDLPSLLLTKKRYDINFETFALVIFHPVTTEYEMIEKQIKNLCKALINSKKNYVIIYPNNDLGSDLILRQVKKLSNDPKIKIFPSIRFEFFLTLLRNAEFIIGNSSAGVREAPFYGTPTIDIGTRQKHRAFGETIVHCGYELKDITEKINAIDAIKQLKGKLSERTNFGSGDSDKKFLNSINSNEFWRTSKQKQFRDIQND